MIDFKLFFCFNQLIVDIFDFVRDLISLFLKIRLAFLIFLYFLVILTDFSYSFKVFMIIFNDVDIWFFLIIFFEFILFLWFLFTLFIFFVIIIFIWLFLFFLHFLLFFQFLNSLSLTYFIVPNDSFSHVIIFWINKLFENFFLIVKFFLEFFIYGLKLINLIGKINKCIFQRLLICWEIFNGCHKLVVIGLHISENEEFLSIS